LRFSIVGCGALGTILGAHLLGAGHEVNVRVRGMRLKQIETNGLCVNGLRQFSGLGCGSLTINMPVKEDILVYAVKTYHFEQAFSDVGSSNPLAVFSLANGVEKTRLLKNRYSESSVLGCMANFSGELGSDGVANFTRNVAVYIGGSSVHVRSIVETINSAGINTISSDKIETEEWSKFVGWVALLVTSVIARADTGATLANPYLAEIAATIIYESSLIALKQGVTLIDRAPFPVATISSVSLADATRAVIKIGEDFIREAPGHRMSAVQDLAFGRELEVEETLGFLCKEAVSFGLDCPCLQMSYNIVSGVNHIQKSLKN